MPVPPGFRAPAVVVVPGLGLDARSWSAVWPHLPCASTVVTLPALGHAAPAGVDLGVEAQAARLASRLPAGPSLVLVGHSASCQVVAEVAVHDERVVGLVLVGPTTDPARSSWPAMLTQWVRTARHERVWEAGILLPQYRRTGAASMLRGLDVLRRHRLDQTLPAVPRRAPVAVRVVRGEHDRIAGRRWCAGLAAAAGGTVTTVSDAGHMVPVTHPAALAAVLVEVVAAAGTTGRPASGTTGGAAG
jgi:pimeloyl-ACP methyl ester carboxylesterase